MLSALDTIDDVLMKGNGIHFQILAAIPAILMATTYSTNSFFRALSSIRAKDLRPMRKHPW
jgi:nuclear-control-of-ATPase protein 2